MEPSEQVIKGLALDEAYISCNTRQSVKLNLTHTVGELRNLVTA